MRSLAKELAKMESKKRKSGLDDRSRADVSSSTSGSDDTSSEAPEASPASSSPVCVSSPSYSRSSGSRFDILSSPVGRCDRSRSDVDLMDSVRRAAKQCHAAGSPRPHEKKVAKAELDGHGAHAMGAGDAVGVPCAIPSLAPFRRRVAQPFSHLLVCDFEATCDGGTIHFPHEIIEFPVVVLDTRTLRVVAEFHSYVRPVKHPQLTKFCTELTGITQAMTDAADTLPVVLERFSQWLKDDVYPLCRQWRQQYGAEALSTNLRSEQKRFTLDDRTEESRSMVEDEQQICFATDGPWDMRRFMHECSVLRDGMDFPPLFYRYINVRHCFTSFLKGKQLKLTHMLRRLHMEFEGQRHSGIADTHNITRVLAELLARGYRVHHVSVIKYSHRGDAHLAHNEAARELLEEYELERMQNPKMNNRRGGKGRPSKQGGRRGR